MVTAGLDALREEDPKKLVSLVRLAWPDIKAALDRGHSVKVIHERFTNGRGGAKISYRLFAMYVGQLRRENSERTPGRTSPEDPFTTNGRHLLLNTHRERDAIALVRVPKRRLRSIWVFMSRH